MIYRQTGNRSITFSVRGYIFIINKKKTSIIEKELRTLVSEGLFLIKRKQVVRMQMLEGQDLLFFFRKVLKPSIFRPAKSYQTCISVPAV